MHAIQGAKYFARELTGISAFPDCCIRVSDCSIRVPQSYFHDVEIISQETVKILTLLIFLI